VIILIEEEDGRFYVLFSKSDSGIWQEYACYPSLREAKDRAGTFARQNGTGFFLAENYFSD